MKDTVTLKELIAIAVRRGQLAVILALAFAALMGGWRSYTLFKAANSEDNRPEEIEKRYQETLETYRETEASLKEQLIRAEIKLASQQEYNDKSFLMKIDSNNKAITTINLAITDVDEGAFQQVFRLEDTPIDFIISKIQSQYIILWNSLDLQSTLTYTPKGAIEDKYLREIVTLSQVDGGCLTLTVFGISEQESSKLADAAYNCLIELQSTISKGSYLHGFTLLSNVTKTCVDDSLESIQTANFEKIVTFSGARTRQQPLCLKDNFVHCKIRSARCCHRRGGNLGLGTGQLSLPQPYGNLPPFGAGSCHPLPRLHSKTRQHLEPSSGPDHRRANLDGQQSSSPIHR